MRHQISEIEYDLALDGDLREMFETMVQMKHYLEVLAVSAPGSKHQIVATLDTFDDAMSYFNASCYWHRAADGRYAHRHGLEDGAIKREYFAYDTQADAVAHLNELLAGVTSDI